MSTCKKPDDSEPEKNQKLVRQNRTSSEVKSAESPSEAPEPEISRFSSIGGLLASLDGSRVTSVGLPKLIKEGSIKM